MVTKVVINEVVPGLNGSNGLIREHHFSAKKRKDRYYLIIKNQVRNTKHAGEVVVYVTRYCSSYLDWDNMCATFKHIGDGLVRASVIIDDSPKVIRRFIPNQIKCKREEQRTEIIIKDYGL